MVLVGLAVTAVGLGLIGLSSNLVVLLALCAVSGVGAGLVNPAQQAAVADVVGQDRSGGKVLASFQMFQDGGAILGPVLIGVVADQLGWVEAFAVTAVISVLAIGPWLGAEETAPDRRR